MNVPSMGLGNTDRNALEALGRASVWLNSEPLDPGALSGRVVLVDFWTYSCINWLRTLPYVRAWRHRYGDRGLTVVGVHTPEFAFEHELDNVRRAIRDLGVDYPVVIDNAFDIWRSFDNHYWPAVYLVDGSGRVRFRHFGEAAYAETEQAVQRLLDVDEGLEQIDAGGLALPADWAALRSPETYLGRARGTGPSGSATEQLELNDWALEGAWTIEPEFAALGPGEGTLAYRFAARDVNLVAGAAGPVPFRVLLDGGPPGDDHGLDVDASGAGVISEPRMYQLVRAHTVRERTLELRFEVPGARAYVFTFG